MTQPAIASDLPAPRGRWTRWLARLAMVTAGLAVGLGVAEAVFRARDGGAFPHLNVYVADPALGVRLAPGAEEDVAFGGNPRTHVRINRDGYRGADLPAAGGDEVLVVGDSQVFGLGVEEDQTFSAKLAATIKRPVMNGGVPTYGPDEYRAVIAEQLAKRHPRTVVLAINLVNDLFEARHPNRERHAVWDGWAVRKETAPGEVASFPGRALLYRRSHLFFALRKWRHGEVVSGERTTPSEGAWNDLVMSGLEVEHQRLVLDAARKQRLADLGAAHAEITDADRRIDGQIETLLFDSNYRRNDDSTYDDRVKLAMAGANPGDIVSDGFGEESRAAIATADQISSAVAVRARLRKELAAWAKQRRSRDAQTARTNLADGERALARLGELDAAKLEAALDPPLGGYLRDLKKLVEAGGARLVVVILPIDVQVSPEEYKKYGAAPVDMTKSRALTDELAALCRAIGVSVLDATPVLAAAEPGAFLDKDIHMTPKGHAAVAAALAKTLAEPPPAPVPASERSPVPLPDVYRHAPEVIVAGSSDAACETKQVREWLRIQCPQTEAARPLGVEVTRDDGHEAMVLVMPSEVSIVVPVVEGREFAATVAWTDKTRVLRVAWPAGGKPRLAFDKPVARRGEAPPAAFRSPVERAICACWERELVVGARVSDRPQCTGAYGAPDAACVARYPDDCAELLACTRRDPASPR